MDKYPVSLHKRAYEMWESGWPLPRIAAEEGMPDRRTLRDWMKPSYRCNCGYHGWMTLRMARLKAEQAITGHDLSQQIAETEAMAKALEADDVPLPDEGTYLSNEVLNNLSRLFGRNIERRLTGNLESDMVTTAYMVLEKVYEALPHIAVRDPYQASQLLDKVIRILEKFRPPLEVAEERVKIDVQLPKFHREKVYGEAETDEDV